MSTPTLFWFRRDLRLADNPALAEAAASGPVVGVFVIDPTLWGPSGSNRQAFLVGCLDALDASMGERLVIRHGDPATEILELARAVGAERVVAAADFGPYGRRRDQRVADALAAEGGHLDLIDSPYAVAPGTVLTGGGTPYKVFTPFFRAW
ncbi:MAG: deoxyribodipyrimidine photo-lyase, partial [Actinomycetota bacterium]